MNNELLKSYFETKIKTIDELLESKNDPAHREYLLQKQSVYKQIYKELIDLNGGKL